ncbi:hypothetical protein [Francisella tularensis]|uniref:hypothetical protein n=1 Tax=Francisella tularensis TaxID=263 RepID=UPI0001855342|nr:hypothetical protein [Francisella tularensis]EDZ90105.1 hypothetical protein FTG_0296 [Francisella tularensis subsp. novicida FTG]MBK2335035.1 hypothetical protein [Francisella tularensis subsp. novicida]
MGNKSKYQSQEPPKGFDLDYYQELYKTLKTPMDWAVVIYSRFILSRGVLRYKIISDDYKVLNVKTRNINKEKFFLEIHDWYRHCLNDYKIAGERYKLVISCLDFELSEKAISYLDRYDVLNAGLEILEEYQEKTGKSIVIDNNKNDVVREVLDNIDCDIEYDLTNRIGKSFVIRVNPLAPKSVVMKEFEKLINEAYKSDMYKGIEIIKKPFSATYQQELKRLLPLIDLMLFNSYFNYHMTAGQYSRFVYPEYDYSDNYIRDFKKRIKKTILTKEYTGWLCQNNVDL